MSTSTKQYEYDPNFYIPEDVKGFTPIDAEDRVSTVVDEEYVDDELNEYTYADEDSELDEDIIEDEPEVPQDVQIISQTVRTGPDGSQVVDVVIEIDDVADAVQYDVRVTKA